MQVKNVRLIKREKRHLRIRKGSFGTQEKLRLSVFRSHQHIYAQLIDDLAGKTVLGLSTLSKEIKDKVKYGGNVKAAEALGESLAVEAKKLNIEKVVFDRGGFRYHGRIKALADAARRGGLVF
jgi:large subunit ribosomal protein L18